MISKKKMVDVRIKLDEGMKVYQAIKEVTGKPGDYMKIMDLLEDEIVANLWAQIKH